MITRVIACLPLVASLGAAPIHAANPERGYLLYQNFCYHCHISEIHYRLDSRTDSWHELIRVVGMWQQEMQLGWSEEEIQDVASWLDRRFYHLFDAPGPR